MIVVSDTTALSTLYLINQIEWLSTLFGQVLIPDAVYEELLELETNGHDMTLMKEAKWLVVQSVKDQPLVTELRQDLDQGESEAIVLALETKADYLLIDERKGSNKADSLGVPTIGLLRVILELKKQHIIPLVRPVLDEMRLTGGFWLSERLYLRVLEAAEEASAP